MDAGFIHVVEIGQCFMAEDTGDLTQFHAVAVKRPVLMRSMKKVFTKNSVLQIDQGNLRSRLA